ncbi:hypothetical protein H101_05579 [Trichophyton interdigitale H6]|nr:hypothetical protein H101_05579 [Trichophyton interdigitale H6]
MVTWFTIPKCESNSDIKCLCPSPEFAHKVISCIQAWSANEQETQAAISFFLGICVTFIPQNPGLVNHLPSGMPIAPPPVSSGPAPPVVTLTITPTMTSGNGTVPPTTIVVPPISFAPPVSGAPGPYPVPAGPTSDGGSIPTPAPGGVPPAAPPYGSTGFMTVSPTGGVPHPTSTTEPYIGAASSVEGFLSQWVMVGITAMVGLIQFAL